MMIWLDEGNPTLVPPSYSNMPNHSLHTPRIHSLHSAQYTPVNTRCLHTETAQTCASFFSTLLRLIPLPKGVCMTHTLTPLVRPPCVLRILPLSMLRRPQPRPRMVHLCLIPLPKGVCVTHILSPIRPSIYPGHTTHFFKCSHTPYLSSCICLIMHSIHNSNSSTPHHVNCLLHATFSVSSHSYQPRKVPPKRTRE
jgi:hypothetical protein